MEQENLGRRSGKTPYKGKMFEPPSDLHIARQGVGLWSRIREEI